MGSELVSHAHLMERLTPGHAGAPDPQQEVRPCVAPRDGLSSSPLSLKEHLFLQTSRGEDETAAGGPTVTRGPPRCLSS